ncbi:MAG: glycosyltransferase [bacterium]|nr:glycosyltransferase [bacterium]
MRVALVHDHLTQDGGAERVLAVLQELFPRAPIYTLVYDKSKMRTVFQPERVRTSFLQKVPFVHQKFEWLFPFMPLATESYDLSEFDMVLSSSSAFSKGVITKSTTLHLCYCHTPTRYLWSDTHSYVKELLVPQFMKRIVPLFLNPIRQWDRLVADRVDSFIANSKTVQERIKKYYRRNSDVIYPPVEVDQFFPGEGSGTYYLAGGRLVSYKRFDIVVEAFNRIGLPLKIFGSGPEFHRLSKRAKKNIVFLGHVSDAMRSELYRGCIAYINPQEEDFGITVIEAAASGRPVIALAAGGALETVIENVTGTFFYDQDAPALIDAILRLKPEQFNPQHIREHAVRYSSNRFKKEIGDYISKKWAQWEEVQHMKRLRQTKLSV